MDADKSYYDSISKIENPDSIYSLYYVDPGKVDGRFFFMGGIIADPQVAFVVHHSGVACISARWQSQAFCQGSPNRIHQAERSTGPY
jgi:hypothetical protein